MIKSKKSSQILIYLAALTLISQGVSAESLFQAGVSQAVYPMQPKSLFSTVRAKTIGDVITVVISEDAQITNDLSLNVNSNSSLEDSFSTIINDLFSSAREGIRVDIPNMDDFGGASTTQNQANAERTIQITDTMTAQVVQVLPNGNLVIQGKKLAINAGEKTQVILSGIVDPRFITNAGTVQSTNIANFQLAVVGNGTVSRHDSEGLINRIFGYIF